MLLLLLLKLCYVITEKVASRWECLHLVCPAIFGFCIEISVYGEIYI